MINYKIIDEMRHTVATVTDYTVYKMNVLDIFYGAILGGSAGLVIAFIIYKEIAICIVGCVLGSYIGIKKYNHYLLHKRQTQLLIEFRECLDFLNASYLVGKNTLHSMQSAAKDCYVQFGEKSYFYQELNYIVFQYQHGQTIETLLLQLAKRMGIDVISQFVYVFVIVYRQGGDLKSLVDDTKDILTRKINIALEIQTILFEQKRQIAILLFMPYILLMMIDVFGLFVEKSNTIQTLFIRTIAAVLFACGYFIAKYMVHKLEREI